MPIVVENINCQSITPANGKNPRQLYEHQEEAIKKIDAINKNDTFRSLLVLPTGGGKTLTAAYWLLKNAVDKEKKVLWIAHRHLLLEQAAEAFKNNAYTDDMINRTVFNYRIISGMHDKPIHIQKDDNILIAGKDSLIHSLDKLDEWLRGEEIYLIIDEAHHAVAKSYKKIIKYVEHHAKSMKMLGLTATPFRTSDDEQGALKQIFTDDIVYKTDLETLIKKGILATPYFDEYDTAIKFTNHLGVKAMQKIENLDLIPEEIAEEIAAEPDVSEPVKKAQTSVDHTPEEEQADTRLMAFLDAESYDEKYRVLVAMGQDVDDRIINDLAVVLDVVIPEGSIDERMRQLKSCVDAQ